MKKETEKLTKEVVSLQEDLSQLTVDKINETIETEIAPQGDSMENLCRDEGILYVKAKRRLSPPLGTLPAKQKKEHARAWEYVKGIYENFAIPGEAITFSLCLFPGDPDYLWEIPSNVPVAVPRMVAKHLEEAQKFHQFSYLPLPDSVQSADNFTHSFRVSGVSYRGKFRPIGAFA